MTLTILCPITSRGCSQDRSQQPLVLALLPSMDALQMWGGVRLVVGYDDDDQIWSNPKIRVDMRYPLDWAELETKGNLTATWNELEKRARPWNYLLPANDDLAFQTSPLPAIEILKERNDFGIVGFHDHAFPGLATFYVVGRPHLEIFGTLYPLPWTGAHQDSWISDVYRPWRASEIDQRFQVHNRMGGVAQARFEYGTALNYRAVVMEGRRKVNAWAELHPRIADHLADYLLQTTPFCI